MRFLLVAALCLLMLGSCKKTVEKIKENALIDMVLSAKWKVTDYKKGPENLTNNFSEYLFQFKENGTVDALRNGVVEKTGTWVGDINARTIASAFTNAGTTLTLLNGTWTITNTSETFVESNQTLDGETRTLRLDKQ